MSADDETPPFAGDPRQRVLIRGRVVLMPRAWRRCASGVTFDAPPTMPQRRRAAPRLTALERAVLEAITTPTGSSGTRRASGIGVRAICEAITGRSAASQVQQAGIEEALTRLETLRLIVVVDPHTHTALYAPAHQTEDA